MQRLNDQELLALLDDIESDRVERKETFKGDVPKKVRQAVCAFSNDLPGYNQPGAAIQFLRFHGTEWSDAVIDEQRIEGSLLNQILALDQKLLSHNRVSVDIVSASTETRIYSYPLSALQQLTRNAVMHRSYEGTNSPVMVYWFNDRIEIINSGGPYGRVTADNFGKPGFADYRNPSIAETMKVLGFVQRFGVGIQMAQKELKKNHNPPTEFILDSHSVLCRVYISLSKI